MSTPSNALSSLLSVDVIKTGLESEDKEEAFEELLELLARAGKITDRAGAMDAVARREDEQSTGIGSGVAIPHGKHASISSLTCALGISQTGVDFDAIDDEPAYVIFFVLAVPDNPGPHVALLAGISRLLTQPGFIRKLRDARSPEEVLSIIRATEEELEP